MADLTARLLSDDFEEALQELHNPNSPYAIPFFYQCSAQTLAVVICELHRLLATAKAEGAEAREDVARMRKALTNIKAAIYGEHGKPSLLGHGHNARYDCGFIANWHSDPNCKIEETARHAEALLLEVHQMTVKVAQEVDAAIDSARAGGSR